jgi:hypothetical protein
MSPALFFRSFMSRAMSAERPPPPRFVTAAAFLRFATAIILAHLHGRVERGAASMAHAREAARFCHDYDE